jgi:hypothetical protein
MNNLKRGLAFLIVLLLLVFLAPGAVSAEYQRDRRCDGNELCRRAGIRQSSGKEWKPAASGSRKQNSNDRIDRG